MYEWDSISDVEVGSRRICDTGVGLGSTVDSWVGQGV